MIELRTLGGVCVLDDTGAQVGLRSRKHVGLLLVLASGGRRVHSRTRLCELFWTTDARRSRHSLSQAIYDIGQRLGPIVICGPGEDVRLDSDGVRFDVREFEHALKESRLADAVEVYAGPFAQNLVSAGTEEFDRWLDAERLRLVRLGEIALRRYVEECESRGRWGEMCVAASRLATLAPFDEEVHRVFMRALWLQGDASSALRHYEEVVRPLELELPNGLSDETRSLARRIRERPNLDAPVHRGVDREPPFVGREEEFQALRDAVENIGKSAPTAIVISGERGIGKSRLLKEFEKEVQTRPVTLLSSRCYQAEEDLPYSPVVDALAPLVASLASEDPSLHSRFRRLAYLLPDFGEPDPRYEQDAVDPAAWRHQLYEEVAAFVEELATDQPVVWIVDDVQWLDRASAGLLHYLSRRLCSRPFLLIATIRARRGDELPTLPVGNPDRPEAKTMRLRLGPMPEAKIREIVASAEPVGREHPALDLAVRLAAGNPYYALEVLEVASESREWAESATEWDPLNDDRLRKLLAFRVGGLDSERMRILQAIAVLERHARPRLVAEVAGVSMSDAAEMAEELYLRSLVLDDEDRIAFTNDAMREFVYAEMSVLRRAALHFSAGRALESESDRAPGSLATHFYFGDDWPRSFGYAMEAACSAQRAAGHAEAAHFAGIAAKVAPGLAERQAALQTRADSLFAAGDLSTAAESYRELIGLTGWDRLIEADLWLRLASVEATRCRWDEARTALDRASSHLADRVGSKTMLLEARHAELALKLGFLMDDICAAKSAEGPIDNLVSRLDPELASPDEAAFRVLSTKAIQESVTGSSRRGLEALLAAHKYINEERQPEVARYFGLRGLIRAKLAMWDAADADLLEAVNIYASLGDLVERVRLWNNLACVSIERGEWAESSVRIEQAQSLMETIVGGVRTSLSLALNQANLLFYQGLLARAVDQYTYALSLAELHAIRGATLEIKSCLGLIALQRRDVSLAREHWRHVVALREGDGLKGGAQERFKTSWFVSWMSNDQSELAALEREEADRDLPSAAKIKLLLTVLGGSAEGEDDACARLKSLEMNWFVSFTRRWARSAPRQLARDV